MLSDDDGALVVVTGREFGPDALWIGPPGVPETQLGQDVERSRLGSSVEGRDADVDVFGVRLCVFHEYVPVPILIEHARVHQFVFEVGPRPPAVLLDQVPVGESRLRILVQHLRVRVRRRAVQIEVVLLDVLAVIPLAVGEPEQPLLEDGVLRFHSPSEKQTQHVLVAEPGDAVLAVAIGP